VRLIVSMVDSPNRVPIDQLKWFLTDISEAFDFRTLFWFGLSLLFSLFFASLALQQAFSRQYVLQDDARHHVFWMARFVDPELFPRDIIADYFQSIAPAGYTMLYRAMASVGVDPYLFAKILPMCLGLITTAFCFAVCMQLLRVPAAGFMASLLLNQSLWMRSGLVSGTPRAFISPLFLAFMFFLLRRSILLSVASIALMALFFPSTMFIALGVLFLRLLRWEGRWPHFSHERRDYLLCAAGLAVAVLVLLPYALRSSGFGPVVTASEARTLPEFLPGGRMLVFRQGSWSYWLTGSHTGMFSAAVFYPMMMCVGLLLPILMFAPNRFPLTRQISSGIALLPRIIVASLAMFFAANALLFRLYLPSRFTVHSFRILLAIAAGISTIVLLDTVFRWASKQPVPSVVRQVAALASVGLAAAALAFPFVTGPVVDTRYKFGENPELYEFLARQPKDVLIASLANDVENLPMFARRSILVGRETALPFHKKYYSQIRERAVDLINAQYSTDIGELRNFIQKYGVSFMLVDRNAFTPQYVAGDKWVMQYQPAAKEAVARLKQGELPALSRLIDGCSVLETNGMSLIPAECILTSNSSR
jgi:hypothetical protein